MYEPNIYVNNSKFILIIDNFRVLQLFSESWALFYTVENLPRVNGL